MEGVLQRACRKWDYEIPPVPCCIQNSRRRVTPEIISRPMAVNAQRAKPLPAAKEMIAANAAPPAPTGAITLPIQLIRFNHVPSGCAPVWPWTATFVWGADPRFCAINPASVTTSRARMRATGSARRHVLMSLIGLLLLLPPLIEWGLGET